MTSTKLTALAFAAVLVTGCATHMPTGAPGFQYRVPAAAYQTSTTPAGWTDKAGPCYEGVVGGRSVGAPGVLRMLELAHKQYGKLSWAALFAPAIKLAEDGFALSPILYSNLKDEKYLQTDAGAAAYFYQPDGQPKAIGTILKNPDYAKALREIAAGGADAFYTGRIAKDIEAKVKSHPTNPGGLTARDIAGYRAKERQPVCSDYKAWTVCGMPPPSSGGIAIAQMLGMLEVKDIRAYAPQNGELNADG